MTTEVQLQGIRIVQVGTPAGPLLYRVEVLWYPSTGWKTDLVTHNISQAQRRAHELQDGLDAADGEQVMWSWHANGFVQA